MLAIPKNKTQCNLPDTHIPFIKAISIHFKVRLGYDALEDSNATLYRSPKKVIFHKNGSYTLLAKHKQSVLPIILGVVLTLITSLFYLSNNPTFIEVLQRLEAIPYDIRLKLSTPIKRNDLPPIIIIDIDEASLKKEGRWPWSRIKIANLINKLSKNNVAVIAMDVVQSEKEESPLKKIKRALANKDETLSHWLNQTQLKQLEKELDADAYFASIIKDKEIVLGYPFFKKLITQAGKLPPTSITSELKNIENLTAIHMLGYTANLNDFTNNAAGSGFFSIAPDRDGNVRRAPIVASYNDQIYPSLALETARLYLLEDSIQLHTETIGSVKTITHVSLGKLQIPTDAQGQILIPYLGKRRHFPYLSATEVLHSTKPIPDLENAIVLIGTSAIGLADLRATPVQASFPGVEIQANILHGILHPETIAYIPDWTEGATILWLVFLGILMTLIYPLLSPITLVLSGTGLLLTTFATNYWLWAVHNINLPVVMPLLLIMVVSSIYVVHYLLRENRDRRQIHDMFGQYVPLEHINKLIENPAEINTHGEKREMTVLFSDLRNFTTLSEPLTTRELKTFLNQYLTPITKIIFDNQGTIDKYVGDMVMAFWGAPLRHPEHAFQAVKAALQMQKKITKMQAEFARLGLQHVAAGIGIHTGEMNVGDMGSDYRRAYTVLGDAVNLGSRLEGLTKYYDVKILVSEKTKEQCPDIVFRYIDYVRVKGKQDAIKIYEPVSSLKGITSNLQNRLELHEKALNLYLNGEWEKAASLLNELFQETNEALYQIYLDRIASHKGTSSENWSPVHTHTEK